MNAARPPGVIVTAASTPAGRRLVESLVDDAAIGDVLAVGREAPAPLPPAAIPLACDLTRYRSVRGLLQETAVRHGVRAIVHTPLHRSSADRGREVWRLNVESTRLLLSLAEETPGIERFVLRSFAEIYRIESDLPTIVAEDHPLDLSSSAPQRLRDRIEADVTVCSRIGTTRLAIAVLRCAEVLAPASGSQLHDYLESRVCLRPLGYDPLLNVLSVDDAARALHLAVTHPARGVFNVPGWDTLPLSKIVRHARRLDVPVPGTLLGGLYSLRSRVTGREFDYGFNRKRFHFGCVLDGRRAREQLGYEPAVGIDWATLSDRLTRPE